MTSRDFVDENTAKLLDGLVLDFLQEKDLIDTVIMRMTSRDFSELRVELAEYLWRHSDLRQFIILQYLNYEGRHSIPVLLTRLKKRKRERTDSDV